MHGGGQKKIVAPERCFICLDGPMEQPGELRFAAVIRLFAEYGKNGSSLRLEIAGADAKESRGDQEQSDDRDHEGDAACEATGPW
jgi:hypothetical protein